MREESGMLVDDGPRENFGCERCWPSTADAAWEARGDLTREQDLINEPHFHVNILSCARCTQRFVSVFTEWIDWEGGDDPQYWTLLPITETEAADLIRRHSSLTKSSLNALGRGRRCLQQDYPKAAAPRTWWGTGIFIGPHD
jgi:hypothetical protein